MALTEKEMRGVRGGRIGMVFQEPGGGAQPGDEIGTQVGESLRIHKGAVPQGGAGSEAVRLLGDRRPPGSRRGRPRLPARAVGRDEAARDARDRAVMPPALLIADEPTSALDVTIQAQILALLRTLKAEFHLTVLLITHDFGVVAEIADRVGVMYAGRLVEEAPVAELFAGPEAPVHRRAARARSRERRGARRPWEDGCACDFPGTVPDPVAPPPGCRFHPRCPERSQPCAGARAARTSPGGRVAGVACPSSTQAPRTEP